MAEYARLVATSVTLYIAFLLSLLTNTFQAFKLYIRHHTLVAFVWRHFANLIIKLLHRAEPEALSNFSKFLNVSQSFSSIYAKSLMCEGNMLCVSQSLPHEWLEDLLYYKRHINRTCQQKMIVVTIGAHK